MILTKEKRELLITTYQNDIEYYDYIILSADNDFDRGAFKSAKLKTEIALESLTAEPVNPADCFQPVYLFPPVVIINFPDEYKDYGNNLTDSESGYNDCLAEIKRLNGLGE